jgi:2-methylisocitrate lyase-like PEP mutase family enzyme
VTAYSALGEDEHGRHELQAGRLLVSPSLSMDHSLGYQDAGATAGTFATEVTDASGAVRFPVRLDLDRLLRR